MANHTQKEIEEKGDDKKFKINASQVKFGLFSSKASSCLILEGNCLEIDI